MRKFGLNPSRIHHIFISHLHGDHVFGLFGLFSTMGMMGRKGILHLYGPDRLGEMVNQHLAFFGTLPFEIRFHSPVPGNNQSFFEDDKLTVHAIPLKHRTQTFGYLFREKKRLLNVRKEAIQAYGLGIADLVKVKRGEDFITAEGTRVLNEKLTYPPYRQRSYAYVSDTVFDPEVAEQVRGVDLLFHEATFSGKDEKLALDTMHSTAVQAATIGKMAGAGKLLIGHFSSRYRDHSPLVEEARAVFDKTEGVNDGDIYSVSLERASPE